MKRRPPSDDVRSDDQRPEQPTDRREMIGFFSVGLLLLAIAAFVDPIGSNPESAIIDLGPVGTKWLLFAFGAVFIVGGVVKLLKSRRPYR